MVLLLLLGRTMMRSMRRRMSEGFPSQLLSSSRFELLVCFVVHIGVVGVLLHDTTP